MDKFQVGTQRMYAAFLYFKKFYRHGRFNMADIGATTDRTKLLYWLKKLVGAGWIKRDGDSYLCISYQALWTMLDFKKVQKQKSKRFKHKHIKLKDYKELDFKGFKKHILGEIRLYLSQRLISQIRHRCFMGEDSVKSAVLIRKPVLLVRAVAKRLGFRSSLSGAKYRKMYFNVKQDHKMEWGVNPDNGLLRRKYPPGILVFPVLSN